MLLDSRLVLCAQFAQHQVIVGNNVIFHFRHPFKRETLLSLKYVRAVPRSIVLNGRGILSKPGKTANPLFDWSLANTEKGGGEPTETRFLSLLRNVAVA
jgi:hypothetical protein